MYTRSQLQVSLFLCPKVQDIIQLGRWHTTGPYTGRPGQAGRELRPGPSRPAGLLGSPSVMKLMEVKESVLEGSQILTTNWKSLEVSNQLFAADMPISDTSSKGHHVDVNVRDPPE
jgi:hypothetical protein